jgi:hypothetical protein
VLGTSVTYAPVTTPYSGACNATATGLSAVWGTDDTAAINACVAAAKSYAQSHEYAAQVLFSDAIYCLAGLTQSSTASAIYNAQIPYPCPDNNNGRKLVVEFVGAVRSDHTTYWNSTVPDMVGTVLCSMVFAPNAWDATYHNQSVIGAPTPAAGMAGTGSPTFVNHHPVMRDITVVVPVYANQDGFDFTYSASAYLDGCAVRAFAETVYGNGVTLNNIWNTSVFGNKLGRALRVPCSGNNADVTIPTFTAFGVPVALDTPSEHITIGNLKAVYVGIVIFIGLGPTANNIGVPAHGLSIQRVTAEAYQGGISTSGFGAADRAPIMIGQWSTEDSATAYDIYDGGALFGEVHFIDCTDDRHPIVNGGAPNLRLIDDNQPRGHVTAPDVPASGSALTNPFFRDAAVTVTGGTLTGTVMVDGTATGISSGTVIVPSNKSIQLGTSYTGTPAWQWVLL